jgi:hypothetical protein
MVMMASDHRNLTLLGAVVAASLDPLLAVLPILPEVLPERRAAAKSFATAMHHRVLDPTVMMGSDHRNLTPLGAVVAASSDLLLGVLPIPPVATDRGAAKSFATAMHHRVLNLV